MLTDIPDSLLSKVELCLPDTIATAQDVEDLCEAAMERGVRAICLNSSRIMQAYDLVQESGVKVISLVGFPLGASDADAKRYEAETAIDAGAHELEAVLNIGKMRDGNYKAVLRELRDIVEAADGLAVKAIIETTLLSEEERTQACKIVLDSGAQFICTSGGLIAAPADPAEIQEIRELIGADFGLKAGGLVAIDPTTDYSNVERIGLLLRLRGVS
ncbi:MAG: deoxyribose-phosphate aldolase [Verrucomicrobiales bacterium]